MTGQDTSEEPIESKLDSEESSLIYSVLVIARHKRLVLGLPVVAGLVALFVAFLLPKWYTSTTRIMPPQQGQSNAVAILGQLGALAGGAGQSLGIKNPSDIYVAMLKSRTVADSLIQKFDLKNVYDEDYLSDARKKLSKYAAISASRDGVITVEVEDRDPQRAAAIANGFIEELRTVTIRLAVSEASQRRLFFEGQVKKASHDLVGAELSLKKYVQETGLVNPESQVGLTVAASAALRAQITAKEVQLAATRSFATSLNPEVLRINQEIAGLRTELAKMEKNTSVGKGDVLVSVGAAPEVALEFVRRARDVRYFEALYIALGKQYEIARIDEAKDATLIQVLDVALPPERMSKPRRGLITVVFTIVGLLIAIVIAFLREAMTTKSQSEIWAKQIAELRSLIRLG